MAITGNASYIPTMNEFAAHWTQCNTALAPAHLLVRLPDNTTKTQAQFVALRDLLQGQQNSVQDCLTTQQIARGDILLQKFELLAQFNMFTSLLDGYFQNTDFYAARPYAPVLTAGQEAFTRPLVDMMNLWQKINDGTPPAGVTLPLLLGNGTEQGGFASAVSTLQFAYADERKKGQDLTLARAKRDRSEDVAYQTMKAYREAVPGRLTAHPELMDTMPRLTPLPGHTPNAVNASAVFQAPNATRVVYDGSNDLMLERYELRGTVGDHYDEQDAVVIATHGPTDPREFVTTFGLNQPGAEIALKVFVVLTTGNEAGSAAMHVERPATVQVQLLAA
jgi:hypothetical protein